MLTFCSDERILQIHAYMSEIFAFCGKVMVRPLTSLDFLLRLNCFHAVASQPFITHYGSFCPRMSHVSFRFWYHGSPWCLSWGPGTWTCKEVQHLARATTARRPCISVNVWPDRYSRVQMAVPGCPRYECDLHIWLHSATYGTNTAFYSTRDALLTFCACSPNFSDSRKVSCVCELIFVIAADGMWSVNDNDDLAHRAKLLLNRMCGVIPPRPLINPVLDAIFTAIQKSPVSL